MSQAQAKETRKAGLRKALDGFGSGGNHGAGARWQEWHLVFTSTIGTPLESCNVNHRFQHIAKAAGLPKLRFHDLRHAAATLLLAQGVHPALVMGLVMETLGHSQISLTMNTYSHVIPAMRKDVADKMDTILNAVATTVATRTTPGPASVICK